MDVNDFLIKAIEKGEKFYGNLHTTLNIDADRESFLLGWKEGAKFTVSNINNNPINIVLPESNEVNISKILNKYNEIHLLKKQIEGLEEELRNKIKIFLKEKKWNKYNDGETKISITLTMEKRESFNEDVLKTLLNEQQLQMATKTTTFEKLLILTETDRKRINNIVKGKI